MHRYQDSTTYFYIAMSELCIKCKQNNGVKGIWFAGELFYTEPSYVNRLHIDIAQKILTVLCMG